jgi:hypothetical protein
MEQSAFLTQEVFFFLSEQKEHIFCMMCKGNQKQTE